MTTRSKIALGVVGALAAGVAIGLLIAPDKGSEVRKRIKQTAGEWADNLSHLFSRAEEEMDGIGEKVRRTKSAAEEKVNQMKESFS